MATGNLSMCDCVVLYVCSFMFTLHFFFILISDSVILPF